VTVTLAEQTTVFPVDRTQRACPGCSVGNHQWSVWSNDRATDAVALRRRSCECGWCHCGAGDVAVLVLLPPAQRHGW
jgi:hypothetical protein